MAAEVDGHPIYVGEGLEAAGSFLNSQAEVASEKLQALATRLAPLEEDWRQSVAAEYFQDLKDEWQLSAVGLFGPDGVLGIISQKMNVAWTNYFEAESTNISNWRH
ncbi:WXG100 family type VII secretion target [Actinoplanes sp. L3-i22]|uniref:WXG100 family type VII secretion target n=1 Tax=Actinoplanes sp. L3-i22 TaxID=2836373 RepID=UPI001C7565B5|nr:hypothetical protein [Actinoplanes sp. L3-i22]BCY11912.1 hypothetical protein L3i22_070000 [Actinoplanes sp. L3-i22]